MRISLQNPQASGTAPSYEHRAMLWTGYFLALWLNAILLAALIVFPARGWAGLIHWALWALGLGVAVLVAASSRLLIHDVLVGLTPRERLFLGLIHAMIFMLPAFSRDAHVIPSGFLWATPGLLALAATPSMARRCLAWTLAGAWMALLNPALEQGRMLLLPAGFAVSWLAGLGAVHFAFTGEPYGLAGWWPVRRVVRNALLTSIPALATAAGMWWFWPRGRASVVGGADSLAAASPPRRLVDQIDFMDWLTLVWRGAVTLGITFLLFVVLLYFRRLWHRSARVNVDAGLMPGQVARVEYRRAPRKPPAPRLAGMRGRIVELWGQWAAALGHEGLARRPGETARQFARRLADENLDAAPPEAMTELLERAHYDKAAPDAADLERMREFVQAELSRQSLRRRAPVEEVREE
ncbi:MAG: DUF4129 domain-containing protein [bacterium]|nr:DUF4129 domain-containing protein [bacterium]